MRALKFDIKGPTACFKKPDVNAHTYFTYGHIHKVALCGLLGALVGAGGNYKQVQEQTTFPEYYDMFWRVKCSIVPRNMRGYFSKRIHEYTNTTGFANLRDGSGGGLTLVVREQWLECPHWTVVLQEDKENPHFFRLRDMLMERKGVYRPFLGQTNHIAEIEDVEEIELYPVEEDGCYIDSLHPLQEAALYGGMQRTGEKPYFFKELSPVALHPELGGYVLEELVHTNLPVATEGMEGAVYHDGANALYFF